MEERSVWPYNWTRHPQQGRGAAELILLFFELQRSFCKIKFDEKE